MRKLREGMADDLSFRNIYWSSNGSTIIEVTHQSSKDVDDRVHPVSYMAFIKLDERSDGAYLSFRDAKNFATLFYIWKGADEYLKYYKSNEPLTGFYHDTYWSAKAAVEMDEDPSATIDVYMKVARYERNAKGQANSQKLGARHYDKLTVAIIEERYAGNLPTNMRMGVDELGGNLQGLGIYYKKDLDNPVWSGNVHDFYWLVTDWDQPPMMGLYIVGGDDGDFIVGDDGDNLFEFPYDAARYTKPTDAKFWVNPDPNAYFDKAEWDLENPKCIEAIVQALVNIHRYARCHLEMVPSL